MSNGHEFNKHEDINVLNNEQKILFHSKVSSAYPNKSVKAWFAIM